MKINSLLISIPGLKCTVKRPKWLGPCYALVSNWRYLPNDYSTWPSLLPISNMVRMPSIRLFPPHRRKSLFASPSVVSQQFSELHRGRHLLYQQLQICRLPQRMDYKLLVSTYRCTHSLASTLLTNEFSVLGQSNARTRSITRGQSFISLSLPNVCHRFGTISPLFTCSLLWNSLPSSLRHPDVNFSRFRNALATYMGFPVTRHT